MPGDDGGLQVWSRDTGDGVQQRGEKMAFSDGDVSNDCTKWGWCEVAMAWGGGGLVCLYCGGGDVEGLWCGWCGNGVG